VPTKEKVMENLQDVEVPNIKRSLSKMNIIREISVTDGAVEITLASTVFDRRCPGTNPLRPG
jgi:metal-sulfur cluster biosynthetic enzyme